MRVAHLHYRFDGFGGGERYLHDLARAQGEAGDDVLIVTDRDRAGEDGRPQVVGVTPTSGLRSGWRHRGDIPGLLTAWRADIVHLHETDKFISPFVEGAIARRWPTVRTVHDAGLVCFNTAAGRVKLFRGGECRRPLGSGCFTSGCSETGWRDAGLRLWQVSATRRLSRLIASSRFMRDELIRNGCSAERVDLLPPWTEAGDADPAPPPTQSEPLILFVGRLDRGKGVGPLVAMLDRLSGEPWRAAIVGDGPSRGAAERLAETLGLGDRIEFTGALPSDELAPWFRRSRLVCMPSLVPETFGLVGIEAMAFARPVVAFATGGARDWLVNGETGFLAMHGDSDGLALAAARLLADRDLAERLGRAGRARVDALYRRPRFLAALAQSYARANGADGPVVASAA